MNKTTRETLTSKIGAWTGWLEMLSSERDDLGKRLQELDEEIETVSGWIEEVGADLEQAKAVF